MASYTEWDVPLADTSRPGGPGAPSAGILSDMTGELAVVAYPPPRGTLRYWISSVMENLPAIAGLGGVDEAEPASVVVRSPAGAEVKMLGASSMRSATRAARRLETERRRIGDHAFCVRYALPMWLIGE